MEIKEFAERYRVKTRKDSCEEAIIPGKPRNAARPEDRHHIYDHGNGKFGVCLLFTSVGKYHNAQKRLVAAGFTQGQDGDSEGTFLFDPADKQQAKAAIREAGIRIRKELSAERLQAMKARGVMLAQSRRNPQENASYTA